MDPNGVEFLAPADGWENKVFMCVIKASEGIYFLVGENTFEAFFYCKGGRVCKEILRI